MILVALLAFFVLPHSVPFITSQAHGAEGLTYSISYYVQLSRQALLSVIVMLIGIGFIAFWIKRSIEKTKVIKVKIDWFWPCVGGLILSNQVVLWVFVMPTYYSSM